MALIDSASFCASQIYSFSMGSVHLELSWEYGILIIKRLKFLVVDVIVLLMFDVGMLV